MSETYISGRSREAEAVMKKWNAEHQLSAEDTEKLKELADGKDPSAMAVLGDYYFYTSAPEHWDLAYGNYTGENALPLTEARQAAVKDILNHGKYQKRILILSIVFCAVTVLFMLLTASFALFYMNPVIRILFIVLEALIAAAGIRSYKKNRFTSLRWMLPDLLLIWCLYLFLWLM